MWMRMWMWMRMRIQLTFHVDKEVSMEIGLGSKSSVCLMLANGTEKRFHGHNLGGCALCVMYNNYYHNTLQTLETQKDNHGPWVTP